MISAINQQKKEKNLLKAVFNARFSALIVTDKKLSIHYFNRSTLRILKQQEKNIQGMTLTEILNGSPDLYHWIDAQTEKVSGQIRTSKAEIIGSDESVIHIKITCADVGMEGLLLWDIKDVSQEYLLKSENEYLERSLSQAEKMSALGTLASGIAHEINTPLQYVTDNIKFLNKFFEIIEKIMTENRELIEAVISEGVFENYTNKILDLSKSSDLNFYMDETPIALSQSMFGLEQVTSIVSAIREFSHPGVEKHDLIDINAIVKTAVSVCRNNYKYVADITCSYSDEIPRIIGNSGELHQLILNLIGNAAHAIEERFASLGGSISIETSMSADWVEVAVIDNGSGMDEATIKRAFDPFFTTKAPGQGTGQGLAIAYNIVHVKHRGKIKIASKINEGTTIKVQMPLTK